MVPGVLTLESAAATAADGADAGILDADGPQQRQQQQPATGHDTPQDRDGIDADGIATQAAGVQLIYEGLRLTRSLAHEEPWSTLDAADPDEREAAETGDLEILAADILVARGFYLLARTDAAGKAVRTVQAFGRDQTRREAVAGTDSDAAADDARTREHTDPASIDANLERDILELAVLTGATAVGGTPSSRLLTTADAIADAVGTSFPPATECLGDLEPSCADQSLEEHTTDRATSATDP